MMYSAVQMKQRVLGRVQCAAANGGVNCLLRPEGMEMRVCTWPVGATARANE
jgi:hypothetical protein